MSTAHECCICLRTEDQLRETFRMFGQHWCCRSCVVSAVSFAYSAACRFGAVVQQESQ